MRLTQSFFVIFILFLGACSGKEPAVEKAVLGTWVQETPTSMTARGIQTTTTDTVLRMDKNGETYLTRNLTINGQKLPAAGVELSIELRGNWNIANNQLTLAQSSALILPRNADKTDKFARDWAKELQRQADAGHTSVKNIILANKKQLILQDDDTGTTDTYRRK